MLRPLSCTGNGQGRSEVVTAPSRQRTTSESPLSGLNMMSGMADLNPLPKSAGNRWSSTAAQRDPAHTRPQDLAGLRAHAEDCESVRGRFFYLRCKADAVRSFAAS